MRLPFDIWLTRAFVPTIGILAAVGLLFAASFALLLEAFTSMTRWHLFFAGLNLFFVSAAYGTWVNSRPLPKRARRAMTEGPIDEG